MLIQESRRGINKSHTLSERERGRGCIQNIFHFYTQIINIETVKQLQKLWPMEVLKH
jgi:hypothetical protein